MPRVAQRSTTWRISRCAIALSIGVLATGVARAQEAALPEPDPAAWQSGRVLRRSYRNEALILPRLVLALPRLTFRLIAIPVRQALIFDEKNRVLQRVYAALTSEDGLIGVRPVLDVNLYFKSMFGLSFFHERIVGPNTSLTASLTTGGAGLVEASLRFSPIPSDRRVTLRLEAAYRLRNDQVFHGIPSIAGDDRGWSRYEIDASDLWIRPRVRLTGVLSLTLGLQLGTRRYGNGIEVSNDEPIEDVYCVQGLAGRCIPGTVDERLVPGFHRGTEFARPSLLLHLDTFDRPSKPSTGWKIDLGADYTHGFTDGSSYARVLGSVSFAVNLWRHSHVLLLRLRSELVLPFGSVPVPFSELVTLGGPDLLRGFRLDRFRDFSSVLASAEYRWPIWMWADAILFVDWGGVAGQRYEGLTIDSMHPAIGAGIRVRNSRHVFFRLQGAYGWSDGFQFYLAFGSGV